MSPSRGASDVPRQRLLTSADQQPPGQREMMLELVTRGVHPSAVVIATYLLLVGLYRTGGGFAAGLVVGLGLVVRRLAGGPDELGEAAPLPAGLLLGAGLTLVAGYAAAGVVVADELLASAHGTIALGPIGPVEVSTGLVFEVGIALIVVGLVLDVLRTLGASRDGDGDGDAGPASVDGSGARS